MQFKGYFDKFPSGGLLSVFNEWCRSKDIYGVDKHEIWRRVRKFYAQNEVIIRERSDEYMRVSAVLQILLERDLAKLSEIIERKKLRSKE